MNRFNEDLRNIVPQNSILPEFRRLSFLCAIAFGLFPNATAQAGSVSATLQVRVKVVSSCRVSANLLQSAINPTAGRLNCVTNNQMSTSSGTAASEPFAVYTFSDAPGTGGAVKILTLNF